MAGGEQRRGIAQRGPLGEPAEPVERAVGNEQAIRPVLLRELLDPERLQQQNEPPCAMMIPPSRPAPRHAAAAHDP
jgi:hypothetical protein